MKSLSLLLLLCVCFATTHGGLPLTASAKGGEFFLKTISGLIFSPDNSELHLQIQNIQTKLAVAETTVNRLQI